jgi:hypothetical protein
MSLKRMFGRGKAKVAVALANNYTTLGAIHEADTANPHVVTKIQIALGNVDDVSVYSLTSTIAKSANYTATVTDAIILCSSTFTLTLPTAVNHKTVKTIKNVGTGTITVACNGAETIDGGATATLSTQYQSMSIVSNGSNWYVIYK